jgi:oxygen-independent coproporphyrinogen-3 oxidase
MQSLYIHIPFCCKKCAYCDFYSISYRENLAQAYIDILCREISALEDDFSTIYIGGGTPTVLSRLILEKLFKTLGKLSRKAFEFTIEANPESLDAEKISLFLDGGVNRISIGVQSFSDAKLHKLGRIHSAKKAVSAVYLAKEKGFKNISIDLIYGVWQETLAEWKKELQIATALPVNHISAYALTYEKNTPLFKKLKSKEILPIPEELNCEMYKYLLDYLPLKRFLHYEVSNFAKKSFECKHNLNYWLNNPYVGLGPGAFSYVGGTRTRNTLQIKNYLAKIKSGRSPVVFKEKLYPLRSAKETAALKIRTKEGIDFRWFKEKTGFNFIDLERDALRKLQNQRFIRYLNHKGKPAGICLTQKGFLFCDSVCSELL